MNCSMPGSSILHYLPELAQIHVIESVMLSNHLIFCCPLLLLPSILPIVRIFSNESAIHIRWPSIGAPALAWLLPMNIQHWFPLGLAGLISLQSKGLSRVFSNTTFQKYQFFSAQSSLWSNNCTWLLEKPLLWLYRLCHQSDVSAF